MKKNLRTMIYVMIAVLLAGGIYLWSESGNHRDVLNGLDPEGYDVEAMCSSFDGRMLICNAGNDTYLCLDDCRVYLRNYDVNIDENGDESVKVSYGAFSPEDLKKELSEKGEVPVYLWLTKGGKVYAMMAGRQTYQNHSSSLSEIDELVPGTHTATCVILSIDENGMKTAPYGYTAEEKDKFAELLSSYTFSKDVKFYRGTVTTTVEQDGARKRNFRYEKDSLQAISGRLGEGLTAHIWLNDAGAVTAVMIHEEKAVLK